MYGKPWLYTVFAIMLVMGMAWADTTLTSEFGDIVPLIEGAHVAEVQQTRSFVLARFKIREEAETVLAFYGQALENMGWRLVIPESPAGTIQGTRPASRGTIHLTLTCDEKQDGSSDFLIRLDYDQGRE